MSDIDIKDLDKAAVLAALFNTSRPQGRGFQAYQPEPMTIEVANGLLAQAGSRPYFDYVQGRVMKVDLSGDSFDSRLFNRDNGEGAAEMAIKALREGAGTDNSTTRAIHEHGRTNAAHDMLDELEEQAKRRPENALR